MKKMHWNATLVSVTAMGCLLGAATNARAVEQRYDRYSLRGEVDQNLS